MALDGLFGIHKQNIHMLFEESKKAIPINILIAFLVALNLQYSSPPKLLIFLWFALIFIACTLRWVFCDWVLHKNRYKKGIHQKLFVFLLLTLFMSMTWGACYFLAITYHPNEPHEFIILLVFAGLCTDAIASLFIWMPAYLAYIIPMFLPIIIHNLMLLNAGRILLATMITLVIGMMIFSAKSNNKLLSRTLELADEKEALIHNLKSISITDDLTGLYNRRYFDEQLHKELNRAKRNKYALNFISGY